MSAPAEAFLDQLVTWRELGFNMCVHREDYDAFETLPAWALRTLAEHARDRRPVRYAAGQLARAETHDPLWNAGQRQLVCEGRKVLRWLACQLRLPAPPVVPASDPNCRGHRRGRNSRLVASGHRFRYPTFREGYATVLREPPGRPGGPAAPPRGRPDDPDGHDPDGNVDG